MRFLFGFGLGVILGAALALLVSGDSGHALLEQWCGHDPSGAPQ